MRTSTGVDFSTSAIAAGGASKCSVSPAAAAAS
jgi:hypothetical protein